ncbi:MAG: DegT/DnrJ/EryC1/StrS family aminotransferase [Bacteroidales bacterium]|nr:DegT/DnrJ/EryC1/StrS family aminotransferase [Bacteroidales bacterium]
MINVTRTYLPDRAKLDKYIDRIYRSGWITNNGELVQELGKRLEEYLQVDNLVLVANGTLALQVAYRTLGIEGEAITTPFSFVATTSSLVWEGLKPVFCDIDPATFNIDPGLIGKNVSRVTTAILPVHVFGNGCEVDRIQEEASKHGLKVIYDAAHAFGVRYGGKSILSFGDASVLSFHATKIFHTIEGGAIIFREKEHADRARLMINFGISDYDRIDMLGLNAKMNEFQAAMGLCILDDIDGLIESRRPVWERYHTSFASLPGVFLQAHNEACSRNYTYFPVLFSNEEVMMECRRRMQAAGIFPRRYFYPSLNTLNYLRETKQCVNSESVAGRILCLPVYPDLSREAQNKIIGIVKETADR